MTSAGAQDGMQVAGINSILPKEHGSKFYTLPVVKNSDKDVCIVACSLYVNGRQSRDLGLDLWTGEVCLALDLRCLGLRHFCLEAVGLGLVPFGLEPLDAELEHLNVCLWCVTGVSGLGLTSILMCVYGL